MAANLWVNAILGLFAFLFIYFFSIISNTWITSLFRAIIGFLFFFIFGYILRFVLTQNNSATGQGQMNKEDNNLDVNKLTYVKEAEKGDSSFKAVQLGSLHNAADDQNPELMTDTIRTWIKENKEG